MSQASPTPEPSDRLTESPMDPGAEDRAFEPAPAHRASMDKEVRPPLGSEDAVDQDPALDSRPGLMGVIGNFVHERPLAVTAGAFLAGWLLAKSRGGHDRAGASDR